MYTQCTYYNPPEKIQDVGLWASKMRLGLVSFALLTRPSLTRPQVGVLDFRRGGLKGNDQKKYTMEVKTEKARKSVGLV